jgi:hypothetical protein
MVRGEQARDWIMVYNNPPYPQPLLWPSSVRYAIYQYEIGASGTPHYQGFIQMKDRVRRSTMSTIVPSAHWEARRGSPAQARAYCTPSKGTDLAEDPTYVAGPWEHGAQFKGTGSTGAFHDACQMIQEGRRLALHAPCSRAKRDYSLECAQRGAQAIVGATCVARCPTIAGHIITNTTVCLAPASSSGDATRNGGRRASAESVD